MPLSEAVFWLQMKVFWGKMRSIDRLLRGSDEGCISKIYAKLKNFGKNFIIADFSPSVIPAQAGIHKKGIYFAVDSRLRGNDGVVKLFNRQL